MTGFAQAYKATKGHRALLHVIPRAEDPRCRAMCGYRPRAPWTVLLALVHEVVHTPRCEPCRGMYERLKRREDRG